jgi:hypothetical protein
MWQAHVWSPVELQVRELAALALGGLTHYQHETAEVAQAGHHLFEVQLLRPAPCDLALPAGLQALTPG